MGGGDDKTDFGLKWLILNLVQGYNWPEHTKYQKKKLVKET